MFGFSSTPRSYSYDSLEGSEHSDIELKSPVHPAREPSPFTWFTLVVCLVCTIFNALPLAFPSTPSPATQAPALRPLSSYTRDEIFHLRRPSHFIGLDAMERPTPPVERNFTNLPFLLTQIDANDAAKVFDPDPRKHMTSVGTISPQEQRMHVSKGISSIVQFRAVDYGMEICDLEIALPATPASASAPTFSLLKLAPSPFSITLYRLNATLPLDDKTLSWNTRPHRVSKLGEVRMAYGTTWKRRFDCAWDDVLTFEVECSSGGVGDPEECMAEWWQDHEDPYPTPAIYITQRATK